MKGNAQGAGIVCEYVLRGRGFTGSLKRMAGRSLKLSIKPPVSGAPTVLVPAGKRQFYLKKGEILSDFTLFTTVNYKY